MRTQDPTPKFGRLLAVVLVLFNLLVAGLGFLYYRRHEKAVLQSAEERLAAIAALKASQVANWYKERLADAEIVLRNPMIVEEARHFLANPRSTPARQNLLAWMEAARQAYDYSKAALYDSRGNEALSAPANSGPANGGPPDEPIQAVLHATTVLCSDLHRKQPGQPVHMNLWVPVGVKPGGEQAADGAFLFELDPYRFLFPRIQAWPTPSETAETLLVRRESNEVVVLNELRYRKDPPLTLRLSLAARDLPSARAALGEEAVIAGRDYRGVRVLAALRAVAGTPWFIVAKVDRTEVYALLTSQRWTTGLAALGIACAASLAVAVLWKQRDLQFVRQQLVERQQEQEALCRSEERYRTLVENAHGYGIYLLDPAGRITTWNASAARIEGYRAEDIVGQHISRLFPPEEVQAGRPGLILREAASRGRYEEDGLRVRKDGSRHWVHIVVTPLRNQQGQLYGFAKIAHDITDRKLMEDESRQLNAQLEYRVTERTAELAAANKELEAFSYSVSHDLRAPLRAIDGFARILGEDYVERLDQEGQRLLGVIRNETQRMGQLIDDLLAFSRLGRKQMESVNFDLGLLARQVFQECAARAPDRQLRFQVESLPAAQGDPAMLRQVFANLIANSIKFTRNKAVAEIQIGCRDDGRETIYFVKDNGAGFDMKYSHKLFGVFQRLHSDREFEGTGVGLALVKRIIHRHGGRVWAEGKLNEGATIYFTLASRKEQP
jgi:PAS domain S-box-containing protein